MQKSLIGAILAATAFAAQTVPIDEDNFDGSSSANGATLVITDYPSMWLDECFDDCAECRYAYYDDDPDYEFGLCMNWGVYEYSDQCK